MSDGTYDRPEVLSEIAEQILDCLQRTGRADVLSVAKELGRTTMVEVEDQDFRTAVDLLSRLGEVELTSSRELVIIESEVARRGRK